MLEALIGKNRKDFKEEMAETDDDVFEMIIDEKHDTHERMPTHAGILFENDSDSEAQSESEVEPEEMGDDAGQAIIPPVALENANSAVAALSREEMKAFIRSTLGMKAAEYIDEDGVEGVRSLHDIKAGELIFWSTGTIVNRKQLSNLEKKVGHSLAKWTRRLPGTESKRNCQRNLVTYFCGVQHINRIASVDEEIEANVDYELCIDNLQEMCDLERSYVYVYMMILCQRSMRIKNGQ